MKKVILSLLVIGFGLIANAQPPAGDAKAGEWYGEKVNPEGAMNINEAVAKLNTGSAEAVNGKVQAKIVDVCPKKGCWLKLELENGQTATVKMKDYGFFLPVAAKGKTVVIDGEVKMKTTSVAELKHYAEDAKKSKEEIDAITQPQKEVRVMAKGIVVVE
jgi:DNA-directed RNA polymerase subunit F